MNILFHSSKEKKCIIGCFTNLQTFSAVVLRIDANNEKYDILDHKVREENINLNDCAIDLINLVKTYKIQNIISDEISQTIYSKGYLEKNQYNSESIRWAISEVTNYEKSMVFTRSLILEKRLEISKNIIDDWEHEYKTFNLKDCIEQTKTYPLIFALWHGLNAKSKMEDLGYPTVKYRYGVYRSETRF
ncbi:MAG: hypothetical protein SAL70_27305 [Scytonema sp. PMC 1070.18]|nr:hypothetical protein [Scytonema sp. PMC 1070.18]